MKFPYLDELWAGWVERYGMRRVVGVSWVLSVGVISLIIQGLRYYHVGNTALLYVGVPYLIALAIMLLRPLHAADKWWEQYVSHSVTALTIFLASSAVLMEGFVCVIFFMPIYFGIVTVAFIIHLCMELYGRRSGKTYVSVVPLLFIAMSIEGTSPSLTVDRSNTVSVTGIAQANTEQVMANLGKPIELRTDRHWMLSIFPMPYEIDSRNLVVGDIHTIRTRYHRWFVTNTHEGELQIEIMSLTPNHVKTRFINDTTFFSTYIQIEGSEIDVTELANGRTEVTLTIDFQRKLDPAWYFEPLQQYAVTRMGEFLLSEVIIRED